MQRAFKRLCTRASGVVQLGDQHKATVSRLHPPTHRQPNQRYQSLSPPIVSLSSSVPLCPPSVPSRHFSRIVDPVVSKEGNSGRYAFTLDDVTKRINNDRTLFANLSLSFFDAAKIGILGVNGCGKSTLLKIVAGVDKDYDGKAYPFPGYKIGYLAQEPQLDDNLTVIENIMTGLLDKQKLLDDFDAVSMAMGEPDADIDTLLTKQAALQEQIDRDNLWDLRYTVDRAMSALSCPPPDTSTAHLSGGEKRRVALCRLLLSQPHILCLDEPTNHLDADSVQWLEQYLATYRGLVIAITHDRYFLDNVAGYILEIDSGQLYPHKGNYASWLSARSQRLSLQNRQQHALNKMLQRELLWLQQNHNNTHHGKNKSRYANIEKLRREREERKKYKRSEGGHLLIPEGPAFSIDHDIINVDNITYWHDDMDSSRPLLKNISFTIHSNDIIGIIGANGTGKTTLLRLLVGDRPIKSGSIRIHKEVRFGYVNQQRILKEDQYVWQEIVGTAATIPIDPSYSIAARAYVAQFNFSGTDQQKRIGSLSGGERNRVNIAKSLKDGCNVIVLDEPTNDLDVDTLRMLEDAIEDWNHAAIIVSHDRWFLDRVCNKLIVLEIDGTCSVYDGGWREYESEMRKKKRDQDKLIANGDSVKVEKKKFKTLAG